MKSHQINAAFIGISHLGLVCSTCWASLGNKVLDIGDSKIISELMTDTVPIFEPGLQELFGKSKQNMTFSSDFSKISSYKLIFFTQDTSLSGEKRTDTLVKQIEEAIPYLEDNTTVVVMSQVPVGFCRNLETKIREKRPQLKFSLYHWVDTIIMTQAIDRFINPPRIIIGYSKSNERASSQLAKSLSFFNTEIIKMTYESAEVTKAFINLYLAVSVTFANTLSDFCEKMGANIHEIIPALQSDKRIGQFAYLRPNLRISGGHLERDLDMLLKLSKTNNFNPGIIKHVIKLDSKRYLWAIKKLESCLPPTQRIQRVCIWGLAYKKNTNSTHNAASVLIIKALIKKYQVFAFDPLARINTRKNLKQYPDKYQALENSDSLLLLTDYEEFSEADIKKMSRLMRKKIIIDASGIFYGKKGKLEKLGFRYECMGVGDIEN